MEIRKSDQRGKADFGWLQSRHSFSFGQYQDPNNRGFSDLLVINDDHVAAGKGFGTHPHRDMEIFSYVLTGELAHKDSMGTGSVIKPGDVQMMSAGSGITHSEFNPSKERDVHFLQIWIVPNRLGVTPRYQQQHFGVEQKRGRLARIIDANGQDGAISVYQDARVYAGLFDQDEQCQFPVDPKRYYYLHVAQGAIDVNGTRLSAGDAARWRHPFEAIELNGGDQAEVLLFDLRPNELPTM
jgi:quercetin 2,3-dioxygenase